METCTFVLDPAPVLSKIWNAIIPHSEEDRGGILCRSSWEYCIYIIVCQMHLFCIMSVAKMYDVRIY